VKDQPIVYLAGSIRDNNVEDIMWRERAAERLRRKATIINPLAGKHFDKDTGKWTVYGSENPDAKYIVAADFWAVDNADAIIFDFRALADKYPCIGTLSEWGRSTARNVMRFPVIADGFVGHVSEKHFPQLHPFRAEHAAKVFTDIDKAVVFVSSYVDAISTAPFYRWTA